MGPRRPSHGTGGMLQGLQDFVGFTLGRPVEGSGFRVLG